MTDQKIHTPPAAESPDDQAGHRGPSVSQVSQLDAAVEAAYILEAVRK